MVVKIAICFHLGYNQRFDEYCTYIDNVLQIYPNSDLYITYREQEDPTNQCRQKYPNAHLMRTDRGCDIGSFLLQVQQLIGSKIKYDYVLKIHTKSDNQQFPHWKNDLIKNIVGSQDSVNHIIRKFNSNTKIGMIGSKKWILPLDMNDIKFKEICDRNKINQKGYFVGGTIFWIRYSVMFDFFKHVNINYEYLLCERNKPSEPSYTHAWERILGLIIYNNHSIIYGV